MNWTTVPGFDKYEATEDGTVRNVATGRLLQPSILKNGHGHPVMSLVDGAGKVHVLEVRYIIAATFLGIDLNANPRPKLENIDRDKLNASASNLRIKQIDQIEGEEWKPVEGFERSYAVSNKGRVKRLSRTDVFIRKDTGKQVERKVAESIIKVNEKDEYYEVNLREGDKSVYRTVHRMVAKAFVNNPDPTNKTEVNHIDGNKHNNYAENLEWCDRHYNVRHSIDSGLRPSGKGVPRIPRQVRCIETGEVFVSVTECAKHFGISRYYLFDRVYDNQLCHGYHFEIIEKDSRVKCLDTGEVFNTLADAQDKFGVTSISDAIKRKTCIDGWTFCFLRDDVDEEQYLQECRNRYSKWARAHKRWENNNGD